MSKVGITVMVRD